MVWLAFIGVLVAACALLYAPALLSFWPLRHIKWWVFVLAPLYALALYTVVGTVLALLGISGAVLLLLVSACVALLVSIILVLVKRKKQSRSVKSRVGSNARHGRVAGVLSASSRELDWRLLTLYVACGIAVMTWFFLGSLEGPESMLQEGGDNNYHLTAIKAMIDGQVFSTLSVTQYAVDLPVNQIPFVYTVYYPAAWQIFVALLAFITGASVMLAENAVNFLFAAAIFPLCVSALLQVVFRDRKWLVACGAIVSCACVAFPSRMLFSHQIYPNLTALACSPAVIALLVESFGLRADTHLWRGGVFAFMAALFAIVLIHPGAVFFIAVFAGCFAAFNYFPRLARQTAWGESHPVLASGITGFVTLVLCVVLWVACLDLSVLKSVTSYIWDWTVPADEGLYLLFSLSLRYGYQQYLLSFLVLAGLLYCLATKRAGWLVAAFAVFALIFYFNATGENEIKRLFAGYWYTDPERTAALLAIALIPFSAAGLYAVFLALQKLVGLVLRKDSQQVVAGSLSLVLVFGLFAALNYRLYEGAEGSSEYSGFGHVADELAHGVRYSVFLTPTELSFLDEVRDITGTEALILNMPFDGSELVNVTDDLNVYYRSFAPTFETDQSKEIRLALDEISYNEDVQEAVEETDAQYLLKLHQDPAANYDSNRWIPDAWTGIDGVTDETPGFEVILAEDDMRLYRITA